MIQWILTVVLIAILLVLIALVFFRRKKWSGMDPYSFFIMGLSWVPLGFIIRNYFIFGLGISLMALGLINKDKWLKRKTWNELGGGEKRFQVLIRLIYGILIVAGLLVFALVSKGIL